MVGDADVNARYWDAYADQYQADHGARLAAGAAWGVWAVPEGDVGAVGDVRGRDVVELGCGSASWSVALARAGARSVTGVDVSAAQLAHAERAVAAAGVAVRLVEAPAEAVPLPDGCADVVLSDHGALSYGDPDRTLPECARLLRPGGRLAALVASPWFEVCWDQDAGAVGTRLARPYFELGRIIADDGVNRYVEWVLPTGDWIRRLVAAGFVVEDLIELRPPEGSTTTHDDRDDLRWARRWPAEQIWVARRRG